jgi:thioredoxin 1
MSNQVIQVTQADFEKEVLRSPQTVCVDFYAEWCGPCRMVTPIIEEIAKENQDPNLKFVKVDIDLARQVAADLIIKSIPTVKIFKAGQEIASIVGAQKKEKFVAFLEDNK